MLHRFRLSLILLMLATSPAVAQTVIPAGSDLGQATAPGDGSYRLDPGQYTTGLAVTGAQMTIDAQGAEIGGVDGQSIIYIDATSDLTLSSARLTTTNPEQAAIFLNGGTLRLSDVSIDGPFNFGVYATAGSTLTVNGTSFTSTANGIYMLDKVAFEVTGASFTNATSVAIAAIGAEVTGSVADTQVSGPNAEMGIMSRDRASVTVNNTTFTGLSGRALYGDGGGSVTATDVTMTDVAEGGGFFNVGTLSLTNATIDGTSVTGIAVQGGDIVRLSNVTASVQNSALSTSAQINEVEVTSSTFQTANPERATIFMTHTGAYGLFDVTGTGGYAGLYIRGPQGDVLDVTESRFTSSGFAAVVVQDSQTTGWGAPVFDEVILRGEGEATALALDSTAEVAVVRSELYATTKPPLSFYQSQSIKVTESIIAGAGDDWGLGTIDNRVEDTASANVIRTGIDFATVDFAALQAELRAEKQAAQQAAMDLGQVVAVNNQGMPITGPASSILLFADGFDHPRPPATGEPIDVPAGTYTLVIDGQDRGPFTVTPDTLHEIEVPDPIHPYFVKWDGEQYLRARPLILRPRDELAANWQARSVNVLDRRMWSGWGYGIRRPDLSDTEAQEILTETRKAFYANTARAHQGYINGNKDVEDRLAQAMNYVLIPILAELGTAEDIPRLLETLPDEFTYHRDLAIDAAAMIAARTGALADRPLFTLAQERLSDNPRLALELATVSGVMGNADAIPMVLDLLADPKADERTWRPSPLSYELVSRSRDPRVLNLFRNILDEAGAAWDRAIEKKEAVAWATASGFRMSAIPLALEYVGAFGDDSDADRLVIPLTGRKSVDSSVMGILKDPMVAYLDVLGLQDIPWADSTADAVIRMGNLICRAVERRGQSERESFLSTIELLSGEKLNDLYFKITMEQGDSYAGRTVNRITSAYCNPNTKFAEARRSDPAGLDMYADDIVAHAYDDRPNLTEAEFAKYDPEAGLWPRVELYSHMPKDEILAKIDADPRFDAPLGQALRLNIRALDYRYLEKVQDVYSNGADRRVFNTALAKSNNEAVLSGRIDMRPILKDGTLRIGLRPQIAYSENGFLTPQMTGRDVVMAAALKDGAFGMIKEVRLHTPDGTQVMPHEQTSGSGVHIFALPYDSNDPSGLRVEVELDVFEQNWVFPFPLSYGEFAFRQRSMLP
ncbi:right-handed parallel beta-helix repeat-containing protein [Pseudooceanicola sp. MF1-13]|uniref:right-handed parallel beta-helix repeat-containing protein n=1 Tax=Pseudooceanicola sp. MF1-13 TaxID=3379095 RepID=UPI0038920C5B